jgi:hypothetical protein
VLGHDALPLACRQFPRVSITDPRGVSVALSHYCPTAAALLDDDEPVAIAIDAPSFPPSAEYVGLDATTSLPPLLRPDMLMDWESWWEWERLSVDIIANSDDDPARSLARLGHAVEHVRPWLPADGALIDRVRESFDHARRSRIADWQPGPSELDARRDEILGAIPPHLAPRTPQIARRAEARRLRTRNIPHSARRTAHFLVSHAFANWTAHLGRGLRTWQRSIEAPLALLLSGLDVRNADLWLRHLADPGKLADAWGKCEG